MFRFTGPFRQVLSPAISAAIPIFLFLLSTMAFAQTITAAILHGDFSDIPPGAVMYLDVEETSFSEPIPPPLYGAPTIAANTLDFDPRKFSTSSLDGGASQTDGQLTFTISSMQGTGLTGFSIIESGEFQFSGIQAATETYVSASTDATVSILAVDGLNLPSPIPLTATRIFTSNYESTNEPPIAKPSTWSLATFVDLAPAIPVPYINGVTKLEVSIENQLTTATGGSGMQAAIDRTDVKIRPNVVPEPCGATLACLVGLFATTRRRVY